MQGTTTAPMKQAIPRYKSPEITLQELRALAWLSSLSHKEYGTLVKEVNKTKPPIGPQGPEVFMEEWDKALLAEGKALRTVEIYLSDMGTLQRFLIQQEIDITDMGTDLVRKYATHITRFCSHFNVTR